MTNYFLFLAIGKLLLYIGMKFPMFEKNKFLKDLFSCDLCLGVWCYTILSVTMQVYMFQDVFYFPFISELVTGCASSFLVHLVSIGWREKFTIIVIE